MSADREEEAAADEPPLPPPPLAFFVFGEAAVADAKSVTDLDALPRFATAEEEEVATETDREAKARGACFFLEEEAGDDGRGGRVPAVAAACGDESDESQSSSIDGCLGCRSILKPLRTEKDETLQRPLQLGRSSHAAATAAAEDAGRLPIFDFAFCFSKKMKSSQFIFS